MKQNKKRGLTLTSKIIQKMKIIKYKNTSFLLKQEKTNDTMILTRMYLFMKQKEAHNNIRIKRK